MNINSSKLLFSLTMMIGIIMSISSNNWITIWCGLEISLISIIPMMISSLVLSSESTMKYFIVQSISSSMLMMSMLIMIMKGDYNYNYMLTTSLLIKTGVAPFHNWVLTVIEGLNLWMVLIILTINKVAPITLLSYTTNTIMMIIMLTMILGSISGLNQNSFSKLIGYSSIFNMGLIMSIIKINLMWIYYLTIYSFMMLMLIFNLIKWKINFLNQSMMSEFLLNKMSLWLNILSMGGMPPLLGFSIKYMVITHLISIKMISLVSMMVMMSLITMFFYLRMSFMSMMNYSIMNKMKLFKLSLTSIMVLMINLLTLPIVMLSKWYM
uniref:NADH-ubiquinone oxidoreductase chain 2 n=1 Tax=Parazyginella tiani TaxID=2783702 RepID=A0A872PL90_9HEMI|nr:NADH dehydrogenase subunit 2 [Parazyginella tiani]QOX09864.1 NADH dehydrogenase subunit 2 [Parazyginella tiani]